MDIYFETPHIHSSGSLGWYKLLAFLCPPEHEWSKASRIIRIKSLRLSPGVCFLGRLRSRVGLKLFDRPFPGRHVFHLVSTPTSGGSSDGDPHLRHYDGTRFDCHGQGEFVLTKAAATESEVQARFQQWSQNPNSAVTVTTGIAAREGTSSLIQVTTAASGGVEISVDGELYDEGAGTAAVTGVALQVTSSRVEMSFSSGLDVFVSTSITGMLRVNVYAPVSLAMTGLLGNNNGELGDDYTVSAREEGPVYISLDDFTNPATPVCLCPDTTLVGVAVYIVPPQALK